MEDDKYISWHKRVDEKKIGEQAIVFIEAVKEMGLAVTEMHVQWDGRSYKAKTCGKPIAFLDVPEQDQDDS